MEILQLVRARGERWRVTDVRAYSTCRLMTLANSDGVRQVLTPFDDVEPIAPSDRPLAVSARRWRHCCRASLAADTPPGRLRTAARARIDLLAHQLEPALAILRGAGSRLLLADDVGLGKTIQAGLIIAELLARGCVERVLILTPAGVRDQWVAELLRRFGIVAAHADAGSLRRLAATLPLGINPWATMPIAVASIDYFKRLEVLPAARSAPWDIVVVDEAHASAGDSERSDAVRLVAERAAYVILLTATPHSGDDKAFEALCGMGAVSGSKGEGLDRLIVFRRTRRAIRGDDSRRIHLLHVRPSVAERHMHDALAHYRRAVTAEHGDRALALSVLEKRALSSPWSLAQSIDRRLATLDEPRTEPDRQLPLPLGDPDGELTDDDAPPVWPWDLALADASADRRLLTAIAAAARSAALHDDSKLRCLTRLLRRVRESVLVFTEYRDSAHHLWTALGRPALLLHGGLDRHQRASTHEAFTREPGAILIATDAAGQGLNLHHACRLVVNLELPWNPMRLEQRIGRVDRIGQTRRVHAVHLIADGTRESAILGRLKDRVARAQATIASPDPIGLFVQSSEEPAVVSTREEASARTEVERLERLRVLLPGVRSREELNGNSGRPLLVHARRRALKTALGGRTLLIYRLTCEDADGRVLESGLVSLLVAGRFNPADVRLIPQEVVESWRREVTSVVGAFDAARTIRERAIAARLQASPPSLFQPALFGSREEVARGEAHLALDEAVRAAADRLASIERRGRIGRPTARLLLVARP